MLRFGKGIDSAAGVCDLARSACAAFANPSVATQYIASAGNWGKWPQNIERDLGRFMSRYCGIDIEKYMVPIRACTDGINETVVKLP
eukprot:4792670-Alexandrium_andersonii.AAC.1